MRKREGELATIQEIHQAFESQVGKTVHATSISRLLDRHGWRKLMPRPRHPKTDLQAQEPFKKTIRPRLHNYAHERKADAHRPVVLLAQDEARFGRMGEPRRCRAPAGIRPHSPQQAIRQAVYAFAALAPQQGKMTMLILPSADTAMMTLFLDHVSQEFATSFVIMQVDQAGWHRSLEVHIPENIRLVFQPASSPELNPVEHLWDELREKYFFNRIFSSLDSLQEQLCLGLNNVAADPDLIRSMTLFPHFCISNKNAV